MTDDKKPDPPTDFHLADELQKLEHKLVTCSVLSFEWRETLEEINRLAEIAEQWRRP